MLWTPSVLCRSLPEEVSAATAAELVLYAACNSIEIWRDEEPIVMLLRVFFTLASYRYGQCLLHRAEAASVSVFSRSSAAHQAGQGNAPTRRGKIRSCLWSGLDSTCEIFLVNIVG